MIINTFRDLENWVWEHAGANMTRQDITLIANWIRSDSDFPHWGRDCSNYLESLPELVLLLDEMTYPERKEL